VLQKFQFEDEADRIQAEVGARNFENGRAAHVGPDDFFNRFDSLGIDVRAVHSATFPTPLLLGYYN
jgi:hypothetical protein